MIQLSNILPMTPETPAKTVGVADIDSAFAKMFAGELEGDAATGGKVLPVALPEGGKNLPVELPVAVAAEAQAAPTPDEAAVKTSPIDAIVIPSIRLAAAANSEPALAEEAQPKSEAPRAEALPQVAAKAIVVELKARIRADRPATNAAADKPTDPETAVVNEAGVDTDADAPVQHPAITGEVSLEVLAEIPVEVPATLLVTATAVAPEQAEPVAANILAPVEQPAAEQRAEVARPEAKQAEAGRGDTRLPAPLQAAMSDQTGKAGETIVAKDGARQGTERDSSAQGDGARGQRGAPELRFELSRASGGERAAPAQAAQTSQIRMPLAAASQIVLPEAAAISGHVADASALPGAANQASTSFASQQGVRPHDFTSLVDRLVEARETARGGSVNVAVMHAEFGEVSLRFRQDAGGLSVSMSNSDPEFARAVGAATQADGAQMGNGEGQGGRKDDGSQNGAASSRTGTGGDWGQSSADAQMNGGGRQPMRDDARGDQVAAQSRAAAGEERPGRDGIYA